MTDETLFATALDHPDPGTRAAFLASACPDPDQRRRVEALLAAHTDASGFLSRPALDSSGTDMPTQAFAADAAEPDVGETVTRASGDVRAVAASDALAFLQPSQRPGSLGRIAHYEVQAVLGSGGFGTVLKAFDERLHRVVAVKVLAPQLAASGAARARFLREGRSAAAVRDEHVVNVYAVSDDAEPIPYMVMEFVSGQTLQQKLDKVGPLPPKEVLRIGLQVARGLVAAHATGLIHRDIKPANILLENGVERVKITDFGLARAADDASISQSGVVAGTPMYMSPEQARGDQLDHRSDLFSLGSVLYALCAGRPPFRAETTLGVLKRVIEDDPRPVRGVNSEIPQWLADVVARLLAKAPADRFQTAAEVADLLGGYLAEFQQCGTVTAAAGVAPRRKRSRWAWPVAVGVVNGLIIAVLLARPWAWFEQKSGKKELESAAKAEDGWVPLFNGKDLSGWTTQTGGVGNWELKDGAITCTGPRDHLYTIRDNFADFHLRAEVKVNAAGNSGIYFRTGKPLTLVGDYEAQIATGDNQQQRTGSLYDLARVSETLVPPDTWFTLEVIAQGNRLRVWVNGKGTADYTETRPNRRAAGYIALQHHDAQTSVHFRKIEIKELKGGAPAPLRYGTWTPLFDGKTLSGWKTDPAQPGGWSVEDGLLTGRSNGTDLCHLFTERDDLADFQLRVVARANKAGNGGIFLRAPFGLTRLNRRFPTGYEIQILHAHAQPNTPLTGSVYGLADVFRPLVGDNEWFEMEVLARDSTIVVSVNGKPAATYTDPRRAFGVGHLALQAMGPDPTVVQFRTIEVMNLARPAPGPLPPAPRRLPEPTVLLKQGESPLNTKEMRGLAVRPGGAGFLTGSHDGKFLAWEGGKPRELLTSPQVLWAADVTADGKTAAVTEYTGGGVRLWDLTEGRPLFAIPPVPNGALPVAFSPDGRTLAVGTGQSAVFLWDWRARRVLGSLPGPGGVPVHSNGVRFVRFADDGLTLYSGCNGGVVAAWDVPGRSLKKVLYAHGGNVVGGAVSPDGTRLYTSGFDDQRVVAWDTKTWKPVWESEGGVRWGCVAVSPDGSRVAACGSGVRVWDAATGAPLAEAAAPGYVQTVAFDGPNKMITVGSQVAMWDLSGLPAPGAPKAAAPKPDPAFAVLAKGDRPEARHRTLEAAVAEARAGDTIEVRGDGPFSAFQVVTTVPLTIRAGDGFRPVLRATADGPVIEARAPLVLEGLELSRVDGSRGSEPSGYVVDLNGASVRAANCRFVASTAVSLHARRGPSVELRNCELVSGYLHASTANWDARPGETFRLENCVSPNWGVYVSLGSRARLRDASVRLSRCSLGGRSGIVFVDSIFQGKPAGTLSVEVDRTALTGLSPVHFETDVPVDEWDSVLRELIDWRGEANVYGSEALFRFWDTVRKKGTTRTPAEWKATWGGRETDARVGEVRFAGEAKIRAFVQAPEAITAADFRLAPGSPGQGVLPGGKDVGADIDLVGPGAAYERWKKSPEYAGWRKASDELIAARPRGRD